MFSVKSFCICSCMHLNRVVDETEEWWMQRLHCSNTSYRLHMIGLTYATSKTQRQKKNPFASFSVITSARLLTTQSGNAKCRSNSSLVKVTTSETLECT